jgi:hypothetical protein
MLQSPVLLRSIYSILQLSGMNLELKACEECNRYSRFSSYFNNITRRFARTVFAGVHPQKVTEHRASMPERVVSPASAGSHHASWNTARKACSHSIQAAVIPPSAGCFTAIVRVMSMTSLRSVEQEEIDTARELWAAYEGPHRRKLKLKGRLLTDVLHQTACADHSLAEKPKVGELQMDCLRSEDLNVEKT